MAYVYINDFCLSIKKENKLSLTETIIFSMIYNFSKKDIFYGGFKYCKSIIDISKTQYYTSIKHLKEKKLIFESVTGQIICNFKFRKKDTNIILEKNNNPPIEIETKKNEEKRRKTEKIDEQPNNKFEETFNLFWEKYPFKTNESTVKMYFLKHFEYLITEFDNIMKHLEIQIKSEQWTKQKGNFIPAPLKYLREERWKDQKIIQQTTSNNVVPDWVKRKEEEYLKD